MLKYWTTHAEYQHFVSNSAANLSASQRKTLSFYSDSLDKLTSLDLDPVGRHLLLHYSDTGRPAKN